MADIPARKPNDKKGWFTINISLGDDNEERDIFVGADGRDFRIRRGEDVDVPPAVLGVLDNAVKGVVQQDPADPQKSITMHRKRFPYSLVAAL